MNSLDPRAEPVHFTHLKQIARSPAHYLASVQQGFDSPTFRFGRLVHYRVLGGTYAIYEGERRGNAWKDFVAANADREIFTRKEVDDAEPIAKAVREHPIAGPLLVGECELDVSWQYMGRACSSRLDVLNRKERRLVDLKTAQTTEPERFAYASRRYSYHAQGAWYSDAAAYIKAPVDEVFLVSVETDPPHAVTVFRFTPRLLQEGRKLCRLWMERLLQCEAVNEWPAYTQSVVDLDVPDEEFALKWEGDESLVAAALSGREAGVVQ